MKDLLPNKLSRIKIDIRVRTTLTNAEKLVIALLFAFVFGLAAYALKGL